MIDEEVETTVDEMTTEDVRLLLPVRAHHHDEIAHRLVPALLPAHHLLAATDMADVVHLRLHLQRPVLQR